MSETERVLFVHAHPDDETIATGGTIATLIDAGAWVTVLTCTRGERGEVIADELKHLEGTTSLAAERAGELSHAMGVLGVIDHRYLGANNARWAGRPSRLYRDSGMRWGASGAEADDSNDPESLTSADFGEVAADIAAVIVDVQPTVVVSYNEWGGYGHPDHIRAHQAARRAAEVYGVPFFAIEPGDTAAAATMTVDVAAVLPRKRAALEQYATQVAVDGDEIVHPGGQREAISAVENYRRVRSETPGPVAFSKQSWATKIFAVVASLAAGFALGSMLTIFHQDVWSVGEVNVPRGLIISVLIVAAVLVGSRLAFGTRVITASAAIGIMVAVALLSLHGAGGTVLIPDNASGVVWAIAPTAIAFVVLAWPRIPRRPAGKIASSAVVMKGQQHQ